MKHFLRAGVCLVALAGCAGGVSRNAVPSVPVFQQSAKIASPRMPSNAFVFSQYKDVTVNMNWNTNVISTKVTGTEEPVPGAMPAKNSTLTWAFATGTCGSETWEGIPAAALRSANVQSFANAGKDYVISTGGAGSTFTCPTTSAFLAFVKSYYSANMIGVDFDIESGQSQTVVNDLVRDVEAAQPHYPHLRFSFTVGTLGGNANPSLGHYGILVMNAIKHYGLTKYTIDLMTMDYGSATPGNCVIVNGNCEMGKSAVRAAENLNAQFGVPYNQIELTPMIGGNDSKNETFTIPDVATVSAFVKQQGLAGVHFWSFDRDRDCKPGPAQNTCNTYGKAGTLGFTNAFVSDLGL